ncbi:MAG: hypothetical protein HZR80_09775 [Candidatus Heimdallarchaeota archaeon]
MIKKLELKRSNALIFSMILLLIVSSIIFITPVFAGGKKPFANQYIAINNDANEDEDNDGVNDDFEDQNQRDLDIDYNDTEATLDSKHEYNEENNEFQISIHTEIDKLSIKLEYSTEDNDNETVLEFTIELTQLIGYNDIDANNIYNPTIDDTIEVYNIGGFDPIEYSYENRTDGEIHVFRIMSTDNIFGIVLYASNEFINVNNTMLTPAEIKFDIIINDFVGDFTRVALKSEFVFEGEVEHNDNDTEDEKNEFAENEVELVLNLDEYTGFFSWNENATTDGIEYPVYYSPFDSQILYLNYKAGNQIIHDPKIGVANIMIGSPLGLSFGLYFPELSRNGFLILTATAALIAISISGILFRRKKK